MANTLHELPAPYSNVTIDLWWWNAEKLIVTYKGPPDDLIAVGVATPELLARGKTGKIRRDAAGVLLIRRKGQIEMQIWKVPLEIALTLPGVTDARIAEIRARCLGDRRPANFEAETKLARVLH